MTVDAKSGAVHPEKETADESNLPYFPVKRAPFSVAERLRILTWEVVRFAVFKRIPGPARIARTAILRAFGAQIDRTASVNRRARVDCPWNLVMAPGASIGEDAWVYALDKVTLGKDACVGQRVCILTGSHDPNDPYFRLVTRPVHIGTGAWVAAGSMVLPGADIGDYAVVGAGSVVARSVPASVVVAGNPIRTLRARILGKRQ